MTQTAEVALRQATLYSDGRIYRLLQLPPNAITLAAALVAEAALPFSALLADKDEVTLLLPDDVCQEFARRLRYATISDEAYRQITFDIELDSALVGFMALVSRALADNGIPILTYAAFSRDHVVLRDHDFDKAMHTLNQLQKTA
ncbi:MAG: ACT domain-containing protein [Chloroflexi bacterium]|nr:ACT domain-containing protein [Chloroflexota bacterium]